MMYTMDSRELSMPHVTKSCAESSISSELQQVRLDSDVFSSEQTRSNSDFESLLKHHHQQPDSVTSSQSDEKSLSQSSQRLVQNCGPDCMMSQKIVDKLLSRMLRLENERSELLAANRSWAVQFDLMKERYKGQINSLKEEVKNLKKEKEEYKQERKNEREVKSTSSTPSNVQDQLNLLTHQAEIYKEDFLEERKARVRAHSKIEELRTELRREKKSRAKLAAYVQQKRPQSPSEKTSALVE